MSFGQDIPNAREVILLIEDADGRQHGWKIHNPANVRWTWDGSKGGNEGAQGTVTASGTFQRMSKSPRSREIEAKMIAAIETLEGGARELPR
jgi:hypothetical protein